MNKFIQNIEGISYVDPAYYENFVHVDKYMWKTGVDKSDILCDVSEKLNKDVFTNYQKEFNKGEEKAYVCALADDTSFLFVPATRKDIEKSVYYIIGSQNYYHLVIKTSFSDREYPINIIFNDVGDAFLSGRDYELIVHMSEKDLIDKLESAIELLNESNSRSREEQ